MQLFSEPELFSAIYTIVYYYVKFNSIWHTFLAYTRLIYHNKIRPIYWMMELCPYLILCSIE